MNIEDLGKTIAKYAPALGAVLPIPGGFALGQVVASLFGGDINNPDDLLKRIQSDPDAALKLAQFEMAHKVELEKIALQSFEAETADKVSARQREIALAKIMPEDRTIRNLSYIITLGFFCALFFLFFPQVNINEFERSLLSVLIGMLASKWQTIIDYLYGDSRKDKV